MDRSPRSLIPFIDLTSLNNDDTPPSIQSLCERAQTEFGPVAAICVYPKFVAQAVDALSDVRIRVATVINFPAGDALLSDISGEVKTALQAGANELDVVIPYQAFKHGDYRAISDCIALCRSLCDSTVVLKAILETGALTNHELIAHAAQLAIDGGADFIKTSTGKIPYGASLGAAEAILQVIAGYDQREIGLKISGGIRTTYQAMAYVDLFVRTLGEAALTPQRFRIGASQLLDELL